MQRAGFLLGWQTGRPARPRPAGGGKNGRPVIYRLTTYKQNPFRPTKYPTANRFIMI